MSAGKQELPSDESDIMYVVGNTTDAVNSESFIGPALPTEIPTRFIRAANIGRFVLPVAGAATAVIGEVVTQQHTGLYAGTVIALTGVACNYYPETKPLEHPRHKKMGFWGFVEFFTKPSSSGPGRSSGMV